VTMWIKAKKVTEGLDGIDCSRLNLLVGHGLLEVKLNRFPGTSAQFGRQLSIIQKISAQNLRYTVNQMQVGNCL
jgi:hypothetical protein